MGKIARAKEHHVGVNQLRDLKGVLEREKVAIGAPITLREPAERMVTASAAAGLYEPKVFSGRYPRLQISSIAELLAGKKLEYPAQHVETFAKAERKTKSEQEELFWRQERERPPTRSPPQAIKWGAAFQIR